MSFLKKLKKGLKTGLKAYAAYQTGGLSSLAASALKKRGGGRLSGGVQVPPMMLAPLAKGGALSTLSSKYGGGFTALPASFTGGGGSFAGSGVSSSFGLAPIGAKKPRLTKDGRVTMRKRHRINPANVKALRRSIRRLKGAEKLFRQVLTVEGKHHAGIKPKTRGKR